MIESTDTQAATQIAVIAEHLQRRYGPMRGHLPLKVCHGDPAHDPLTVDSWHHYTSETAPDIARRIWELAQGPGDVYAPVGLFSRRDATVGASLPACAVLIDDPTLPPPLPPSVVLRTSEGHMQYLYITDRPIPPEVRASIGKGAARIMGGDACWNVNRMGRVPGTFNTKAGGHWPVQIEGSDGPTYTPDELRAAFAPEGTGAAPGGARARDLDWEAVNRELGRVDAITRRIRPGTPTHTQLMGDGGADRSGTRWAVACNLRRIWGLPDAEIAAVLIHFCDWGHERTKGRAWFRADVARCVWGAGERYPEAVMVPTRGYGGRSAQPCTPAPTPAPARPPGRPRTTDADQHLAWLMGENGGSPVMMSRPERARARGLSVRTLDRIEAELIAAGRIVRGLSRDRRVAWVTISGTAKTPETTPIVMPATAPEALSFGSTPERIPTPQTAPPRVRARSGGEHAPPLAAPAPEAPATPARPLTLPELVREGIEAYGPNLRRVRRYVLDNGGGREWPRDVVRRVYQAVRLADEIAPLTLAQLMRRRQAAHTQIGRAREKGTEAWRFWTVRYDQFDREIRRRQDAQRRARAASGSTPMGGRVVPSPSQLSLDISLPLVAPVTPPVAHSEMVRRSHPLDHTGTSDGARGGIVSRPVGLVARWRYQRKAAE